MLTLPRPLFSLVAVGGAVLAGCGGASLPSGEAAKAAQTLTRAFHALGIGDGATVCSLATAAGQQTLASAVPHSSCGKVVKIVSAHLTSNQRAALGSVQVKSVTVTGNQATVRARDISSTSGSFKGFLDPRSAPTKLSRQPDGSWKISG